MADETRPSKIRKLSYGDQQASPAAVGRSPAPVDECNERKMAISGDVCEDTRLDHNNTPESLRNGQHPHNGGHSQPPVEHETPSRLTSIQRTSATAGQTFSDSQIQVERVENLSEMSHQQPGNISDSEGRTQGSHHASSENDVFPAPGETAPLIGTVDLDQDAVPMSKSQQKKLRKKLDWESKRDERKVIRKEKLVAKRERRRAAKQQSIAEDDDTVSSLPLAKKQPAQKPVQLPVTIVIDCDFDHLMRDNERISLASQLTRCYSDNKNSMFRAHLVFCSFGGKLKERFDTVLNKNYESWKGVHTMDCNFLDAAKRAEVWMRENAAVGGAFEKYNSRDETAQLSLQNEGEVVYLSSEADEDLVELKPYSTYIIGGLVDKNREKGICYKRASARNVRTARLPIGEFLDMLSRKVLATNHVNEIMLKWLECRDWGEAFMKVIPKRKGGRLKGGDAEKVVDTHNRIQGHYGDDIAAASPDGDGAGSDDAGEANGDDASSL